MPPNHSRSASHLRIARISSAGVMAAASMPSSARISGVSGIDFAERGEDAAALGDLGLVVVLPARARQSEQPRALGEAAGRIGIGIDEDVAVIEGGDELDVLGDSSMPLPNTSPDMSPTPTTRNGWRWMSTSISRKWRLTHSQAPRAVIAHLLVVVAGRAAGGEGVAEPEVVRWPRSRWRCRRRSPCPCRRRRRDRDRRRRGARRARGGTILPSTMLSVMSSSAEMKMR